MLLKLRRCLEWAIRKQAMKFLAVRNWLVLCHWLVLWGLCICWKIAEKVASYQFQWKARYALTMTNEKGEEKKKKTIISLGLIYSREAHTVKFQGYCQTLGDFILGILWMSLYYRILFFLGGWKESICQQIFKTILRNLLHKLAWFIKCTRLEV